MTKQILRGVGILGMLCIVVLLSGCSIQQVKTVLKTNLTPSETIEAFLMAGNDGKYSEAEKYVSSNRLAAIKNMGVMGVSFKDLLDKLTDNGIIERIEIKNETIRGEGATVKYKIYYIEKSSMPWDVHNDDLIKEDGVWKIN